MTITEQIERIKHDAIKQIIQSGPAHCANCYANTEKVIDRHLREFGKGILAEIERRYHAGLKARGETVMEILKELEG